MGSSTEPDPEGFDPRRATAVWSGFQSAAVGMALADANLELESVNAAFSRSAGRTPEDLIGRKASEISGPEDATRLERVLGEVLRGASPPQAVDVGLAASDAGRALVSASPVADEHGRTAGLLLVLQDPAQSRIAADALKASEDRFRLLVDSVEDYAIIMLDPDGRVATWNTGAERLTGYSEQEILGEHVRRFYTPEDQEAGTPERMLAEARTSGQVRIEGWRRRKDGSRFWGEVAVSALHREDEAIRGFAKITRDLTQRRQVEEDLRQGQKMEALGRLAGGVAHDFNNLLAAILGYAEVLRERLSHDPDARSEVQQILVVAERARDLVAQLLAFSRKQEAERRALDLGEVLEGLEPMLRRLLDDDVSLETQVEAETGSVVANRGQVEQLLVNLVANAQDSMSGRGTVQVRVRPWSRAESGGGYVALSVSDTGSGMDQGTRERAFDPFFTTKPLGKGTGLGLSTVYGVARQSGGHVRIDTTPGQGTTVTVLLPRGEDAAVQPESLPPPPPPRVAPNRQTDATVLLVEDEEPVRSMLELVLTQRGYGVLEARDGTAALAVVRRHDGPVDLVITDVSMPRMGGPALVKELRKDGLGAKVIYISGFTSESLDLEPGERFLQKPFSLAELLETAEELLAPEA